MNNAPSSIGTSTRSDSVAATCADCDYSLQGLEQTANCPECGTPVELSLLSKEERTLIRSENRIAAKEELHYRNRNASAVLAIFGGLGCLLMPPLGNSMKMEIEVHSVIMMSYFFGVIFWSVMCFAFHARYQHALTIRLYRERLASKQPDD